MNLFTGSTFFKPRTDRKKNEKKKKRDETRLTASVLKHDPNTWKVKKNAIFQDKTQRACCALS